MKVVWCILWVDRLIRMLCLVDDGAHTQSGGEHTAITV